MGLLQPLALHSSCCVEISGWDEANNFFVEKADLEWDDFDGKHISLRHMLADGSIVFLRRLQTMSPHRSAAIAYVTEFIGCTEDGFRQFQLHSVQPRPNQTSIH
jgi:hypothetical protein